jgi:photosystem II stability/assembly factor-like uncharacterized protein
MIEGNDMKSYLIKLPSVLTAIVMIWTISCTRESSVGPDDNGQTPKHADIEWIKTNGPGAGPVLSLAIDTTDNKIFAGTSGSGVFKSTDKGQTWVAFNNGLGGNEVYHLAIDATNLLYAALSNAGLYRSSVDSDNWENISPRDTVTWTVAFNSSEHIFTGTSGGLYRSTDNGINWEFLNNFLTDSIALSLAINSRDEIFAGANKGGVFYSTDNGNSWSQTVLAIGTILSLALNSDDYVFAGTLGSGVYFSTDNGSNWEAPTSGFTPSIVYAIVSNSDNFVFAGGHGDGVLRSTDNGTIWEIKNSGLTSGIIYSLALDKDQRLYAGSDSGFVYYTFEPTNIPPLDAGGGE